MSQEQVICILGSGRFSTHRVASWIMKNKMKQYISISNTLHFCKIKDPYHIETSPLTYSANQCIGFYMIGISFIKVLIKRSSPDKPLRYRERINLDLCSAENHFYVLLKSNQTIQKFILSFSISLSVFQSLFCWLNALQASLNLFTASSLLGNQHPLIHSPVKRSPQENARFSGRWIMVY